MLYHMKCMCEVRQDTFWKSACTSRTLPSLSESVVGDYQDRVRFQLLAQQHASLPRTSCASMDIQTVHVHAASSLRLGSRRHEIAIRALFAWGSSNFLSNASLQFSPGWSRNCHIETNASMGSSASTTSAPSIPDLLALDTLAEVRTWVDVPDNLAVTMAALRGEWVLALGHYLAL